MLYTPVLMAAPNSQDTETIQDAHGQLNGYRCGAYTDGGMLLSRRKQNHAVCGNMDGPTDHHTKRSKSGERRIPDDTAVWTSPGTDRLTDTEGRLGVAKEGSGEGRPRSSALADTNQHICTGKQGPPAPLTPCEKPQRKGSRRQHACVRSGAPSRVRAKLSPFTRARELSPSRVRRAGAPSRVRAS